MFVTVNMSKSNAELLKRLFDVRPLYSLVKSNYSQTQSTEEFFKFYSNNTSEVGKYKPLSEQDYDRFISVRSSRREPAITRQITSLAYTVGKRMISLAEGMPNEAVFPFSKINIDLKAGGGIVFEEKDLAAAMQYVPSQGLPSLLEELRQFQEDLHRPPPLPRDVMVTNGGQHGIYQCVELLLEPGDPLITTEYAYTGLHSTLKPYRPEVLGIPEDEFGLVPETLESVLEDRLNRGLKMPKMMYIIPTGNNPTGTVLPETRKRKIYELACRYDFLIVEDDPYMFLNYEDGGGADGGGGGAASFLSLDGAGRVLRLDSVSKVVSAGLRAGWVTAPSRLLQRLQLHAQAELLHSCTLAQAILLKLLSDRAALASHLQRAKQLYRERRDALHAALQPLAALAQCPRPRAGLFLWMRVQGVDDVYSMVHSAFERGLMLVPGQAFQYEGGAPCRYLRLTFSKIQYSDMRTAAALLADTIRHAQTQAPSLDSLPKRVATET